MALRLDQFDVMEHLWETLEKTPDGRYICYIFFDIEQLWEMGFVDTARFGMEEWMRAFDPFKQADGTYLVGHDDFVALDRFRYKGEIRIPFDAMQINEGKYTDDGLDDLISASIAPSCGLPRERFAEFVETLKRDFRQPDGLILIKKPAKERIRTLLSRNPSPLRNLELILDSMLSKKGDEMRGDIDRAEVDAATMEAARQVSSFSSQPTTRTEEGAIGLRSLEKAKRAATHAPAKAGGTELRRIKRSRKGTRG
jgi:hypothetical protein